MNMPTLKQHLIKRLDKVVDELKEGIDDLENLLDEMDKANLDVRSYRAYILDHIKAVTAQDYGFLGGETLDDVYDDIDKMDESEGCKTVEEDNDEDED